MQSKERERYSCVLASLIEGTIIFADMGLCFHKDEILFVQLFCYIEEARWSDSKILSKILNRSIKREER